jgi:ribosomal-protein-alanine N-acetyltransferase
LRFLFAGAAAVTELRTERLVLRAARKADRAALFRIYANHDAMRYWDSPPHQSEAETAERLGHLFRPGPRSYFLWEHAGQAIGTGGIHGAGELGFILHPDHWGQGFAREGAEAVIAHHWRISETTRITANADPRNLASVGLLTRLGFQVTGFIRDEISHMGAWTDGVHMALQRPPGAIPAGQRPS